MAIKKPSKKNFNFDIIQSLLEKMGIGQPSSYDIQKSRQDAIKGIMDQEITDSLKIHNILNDPDFSLDEVKFHMRRIPSKNLTPMPTRPFVPNPSGWNTIAMRRPFDVTTPIRRGQNGEIIV